MFFSIVKPTKLFWWALLVFNNNYRSCYIELAELDAIIITAKAGMCGSVTDQSVKYKCYTE